ncbi:hypothetical protein RS9916_32032 [Synechococcus sp. RS9916]|nr:hypothetical protein RS9916_32032 [Synechococcus sp. RS9916]
MELGLQGVLFAQPCPATTKRFIFSLRPWWFPVTCHQPNLLNSNRDSNTASMAVSVTGAWASGDCFTCVANASRRRCNV